VTISDDLAKELIGLRAADLTAADIEQVNRLMLDYAGVAYGGSGLPWTLAIRQWAGAISAPVAPD
jgi:hypothetical protein